MASNPEFVKFVADNLSGAGDIKYKKMFGEYGLYCNGKYFAAVCDDRLFVKITDAGSALIAEPVLEAPYLGANPMLLIENLEDTEFLASLATATCAALPDKKPRPSPRSKK